MIYRTYQCLECKQEFEVACESGNDEDPPCPACDKVLDWVPGLFSISGVKSKAVDFTQKVLEEDYRMTNFRDNNREGDVGAIMPAEASTSEKDKIEREVREYAQQALVPAKVPTGESFWSGQPKMGIQTNPISPQTMLAAAKVGPGADINPMEMLHKGIKSGQLSAPTRIVGRWRP